MRFVLDFLYLCAGIAVSPVFIYRFIKHKRYRQGRAQRFGRITRKEPNKKCIWLHGVSLGEINAAKTVVDELQNKFSDFEIVISSTTDTGFVQANKLFGDTLQVFYFPFDLSRVMSRAFHRIKPMICLLMELEVWPNFMHAAQKLHVPVIVVNGRISDRSMSGYRKIKPFAKIIFRKVNLVLAQTEEYAKRFKELGVYSDRVIVTGSLKYDTAQITDKVEGADMLAEQLNLRTQNSKLRTQLWVAGATGGGEEQIILDVYSQLIKQREFAGLRLAIVPRKPERFDEVAELIRQSGFELIRYSSVKAGDRIQETEYRRQNSSSDNQQSSIVNRQSSIVIIGDTMGDLRKFYSLATVIFVGRSLVPMGGSDMMEAAALGKCTMFGPYAFNFKQTVDALLAEDGAIMVKDKEDLLRAMRKCLTEPDYTEQIAQNGQQVIRKNQGATAKTIDQIARFLKG
jgi:3-deoxy-D-manno-octulosonic-acid transferase